MQTRRLIEVRELSVRLGQKPILEDISLDVYAGSIHAVIGPNGAGKTTLIRSLLGGMPHRGVIRYCFHGRATIGYVPQLVEFDHSVPMTVQDFLAVMLQGRAIPLGKAKDRSARIRRLLDRTGSVHLQHCTMGSLSGGELQRVMLAQALHPEPEVLILDEPASNVDEPGRRHFERLLRELRDEQGVTIVLVGHHLASILDLADRVSVLDRRLILSGPADEVARSPVTAQVFGFVPFGEPTLRSGMGLAAEAGT